MSGMGWLNEALITKASGDLWCAQEAFAVRACSLSAGTEALSQHVVGCADAYIQADKCTPGNACTLFHALEKNGEEKYRLAIQQVMERLNANPEAEDAPMATLYETLPFRMAYEMKLNRMERVGQTAAAYRCAHQRLWDAVEKLHRGPEGFSLREEAMFLLALTDGIAGCSEQLYEHWRLLVDIYRESLSGVLQRINEGYMLPGNLTDGAADPAGTGMVAWALLTGVVQGLIDPERYLPRAARMLSALRNCGEGFAADLMENVFGVKACLK